LYYKVLCLEIIMRLLSAAGAILAALVLFADPVSAQPRGPDIAAQRAAMERLAPLAGRWQGEADVRFPVQTHVFQTEDAHAHLDGLVFVIRGAGHATADRTGAPVFQAFAVISYDERRQLYEVRAYNNGYATTATGTFLEDGRFQWTIEAAPTVRMRFTIAFDADTWRETGELSRDSGATWSPTVDLFLTRAG
jgi:hypothetical protein